MQNKKEKNNIFWQIYLGVPISFRQTNWNFDQKGSSCNLLLTSPLHLPQTFIETRYRPRKIKYVEFTSRSRVAIFTCKQIAPHEFTGLVMVFKRLSETSEQTISVVNCMKNLMILIVYTEFAYK